jgi:hypothetical protein
MVGMFQGLKELAQGGLSYSEGWLSRATGGSRQCPIKARALLSFPW